MKKHFYRNAHILGSKIRFLRKINHLTMEDLIANNEKDYILKAISKASDLEKLLQTKKELRNKFLKSPLSNTKQYAKHFENCLNLMWKTYSEKKK